MATNLAQPKISLNELIRSLSLKTMRIKGRLGKQEIVVLVNTSNTHNLLSTHNLLDPLAAKKGGLNVNYGEKVRALGWQMVILWVVKGNVLL